MLSRSPPNRRITEEDLLQSLVLLFKEHFGDRGHQGHVIGPDIGRPFEV
jgi:hypothetical protein